MLAALLLGALAQPRGDRVVAVLGTSFAREDPSTLGFPIGWYTGLTHLDVLPQVAGDGMRAVMPYHEAGGDTGAYLDAAQAAGVKVLIEVPRVFVKAVDTAAVKAYVSAYKAHPAVLGWFLADEPTYHVELGPLSPDDATSLYSTIKEVDPSHPVAIAFGTGENSPPFLPAMDAMMVDDYPTRAGSPEFAGLAEWTARMANSAVAARAEDDFFPIIQAFGGTDDAPVFGNRYPTTAEERYMVYASLQMGATGLFFWTHYRADRAWVDRVLAPLVAEVNKIRAALAAGERSGLVTVRRDDVRVSTYRDPRRRATYIVAVHHGPGRVSAPMVLRRALRDKTNAVLLGQQLRRVPITNGRLRQTLGPFGVNVYRVR